ncbi:monovalent cation/H(+) antiporter subunit G [Amorphus orientalis]|uniref:Monovalent cation/proton antiporter MnhG/PhaG subunit n=1 Tax=Amorphus orientalis TaxID=649198 RepID=A0AAE3VSR6_9HYPH|nr:monovalent cation/H(+) antiporter subunit G [Amorphus orientalis]MDQ0317483.1 monovalent cation/proton antiporter MnhG/PhaG subunit [Amorphus orientalis]
MIEVLAYLLKAIGTTFLLIAAVGVVRLPDAFTRMHAATKAGTLGAGLVVLGSALPLESAFSIGTAIVTLLFLLLTVPLASHSLGRAAYIGGAPFWQGTASDALDGTLPRGEPAEPKSAPVEPLAIERIVVMPTYESDCNASTQAVSLGRALDVPVVCLGVIDPRFFETAPEGRGLARERAQSTLSRAIALGAQGAPMELVEADPRTALARVVRDGDLVVLPSRGWFDHGAGREPEDISGRGEALLPLARSLAQPVLFAGEPAPVRRISILDDGSPAVARALATLATLEPFGKADLVVHWARDYQPESERRAELSAVCDGVAFSARRSGAGVIDDPGEVVVSTSPHSGRADWYGLDWRDRLAPGWRGHLLLV